MILKKVLLIEDDTVLRENTAELLELSDYEVRLAANGKKGLELVKDYLPDVIVCDIMMPELDGFGVLKALSQDDRTKGIPFIFLSAKTEHKDIRKGMEHGADDYLTKPFTETELIGAIESRLAKVAILKENRSTQAERDSQSETQIESIPDLKNYIIQNGEQQHLKTGTTLFQEGMHSNRVYLVLTGVIKTYKLDSNGKELITAIYKSYDFFGFSCFAPNTIHSEYA
ncbi:hypothetical protein LCGC14_0685040, partial [marine sediment metagenome]